MEPFWGIYQQHHKAEVQKLLAQYRIGSLKGGARPSKQPSGAIACKSRHQQGMSPLCLAPLLALSPSHMCYELIVAAPTTPPHSPLLLQSQETPTLRSQPGIPPWLCAPPGPSTLRPLQKC